MTTDINPVWSRFCAIQLETWLEWLRNIHLRSYFDLGDRFIMLNPYYYPSAEDQEALPIFNRLMINEDLLAHYLIKESRFGLILVSKILSRLCDPMAIVIPKLPKLLLILKLTCNGSDECINSFVQK